MKFLIPIFSACCLLAAAIFLDGKRSDNDAAMGSTDSRSEVPITFQAAQEPPGSPEQGFPKNSAELQRIIARMDLLVSGGLDLEAEVVKNAASTRSLDDLFAEFRKAGGTSEELLEWLSGVTERGGSNHDLLKRIVHATVLEASNTSGQAAVAWLPSQADSDFVTPHLFEQATRAWLHDDHEQALRWLEQNIDRFEGQGARFVLLDWPKEDLEGAREWVETRMTSEGSSVHPIFVSDLARMWARQDPAGAFDWMFSLEDRWRDWGFLGIAQGVPAEDLPVVADWLRENRDVGRELDQVRSTIARRIARSDPHTASDIAADITNLAEGDELIIDSARLLYATDPETVLRWLPESGLSEAAQHDVVSGERD